MVIRKIIALCLLSVILLVNTSLSTDDQIADTREYALKAAFLYHFSEYVEWDNIAEGETFNIAVLGESPITAQLLTIAKDKKAKNKIITVKQFEDINGIGTCFILFVSRNYKPPINTVISKYSDKPILIVTEQKGYAEKGTQINFIISEDKLKFEVNLKAAQKAGIKISSQLLQHAIMVEGQ